MPALSPTMTAGTIVKWHKKEGEKISAGDILCEVQTDKAIVAYEFDDDGILAKILVDENSTEITVGDMIAIVCGEDDDWKNVKIPENISKSSISTTAEDTAKVNLEKPIEQTTHGIKISPSARNLMDQYGIVLSSIKPTGPRSTVLKEDVLSFISNENLKPKDLTTKSAETKKTSEIPTSSNLSTFTDIELSNMRKTIAKRLTESKSNIPHAYMSVKCFMDEILELRKVLKTESISVSLNDMIVKATALALKQIPAMNCRWNESNELVELIKDIDVSIAVATPTGLITPIIKNANRLQLEEIGAESRELINKAKSNKLQPEEFIGGTFSISNLGMFDIDHFVGVINPPQAAILAVGSTRKKFFGEPDNYHLRNESIMSLSYDSRAIDEELAAQFLEQLKQNLESPSILLNSDGSQNRRLSSFL